MENNIEQDINIIVGQSAWSILKEAKWLESWERVEGNYLKDEEIEWLLQAVKVIEGMLYEGEDV